MFVFWDDVTSGVVSGTAAALIWAGIAAGFVKWRDWRRLKELVDSVEGSTAVGWKNIKGIPHHTILIRNDTGWPITVRQVMLICDQRPSVWLSCLDDLESDKPFTIKPKTSASWGAPPQILDVKTVIRGWAAIDY